MAGKSYKIETHTAPLSDVISDAYEEFETLSGEFGDWRDSIPESLNGTEKYNLVETAADTLGDNTDAPEIPAGTDDDGKAISLGDLDVTYLVSVHRNKRQGPSRQVRLDNACAMLSAAGDMLDSIVDGEEDHPLKDEAETLSGELQETIDNVEGIEIPGMFG